MASRGGSTRVLLVLLMPLVVAGCPREERTLGDALRDLPQDTTPAEQPDVIPPPEELAGDTAPPLGTAPPPQPDTGLRPGEPLDAIPWVPEDEIRPAPPSREWTAGVTRRPATQGVATLHDVRTAANPGFDRVVFEFEAGVMPGYHVEYVDRPIRECGSGRVVPLSGQGWLLVRLEPARMHTDAGAPTVGERHRRLALGVLRELRSICDFEARVEWVLAVAAPNRYRVLELSEPARLVVDVEQ